MSLLAHDGMVAGWNFTTRREDGAGGEEALTTGWPPVHHLHRNIASQWRGFRPDPHLSSFGSSRDFFLGLGSNKTWYNVPKIPASSHCNGITDFDFSPSFSNVLVR